MNRRDVLKKARDYATSDRSDTFAAYNDAIDTSRALLRCQSVDMDMKQCRKLATVTGHVFGDSSMGTTQPTLVIANLCAEHDAAAEHSRKARARLKRLAKKAT